MARGDLDLNTRLDRIEHKIDGLAVELAKLKIKAAVAGAGAGLLLSLIVGLVLKWA